MGGWAELVKDQGKWKTAAEAAEECRLGVEEAGLARLGVAIYDNEGNTCVGDGWPAGSMSG